MRVLLAGGGTAGHTSPLLATADALRRLRADVEVTCLGTERGIEMRVIPAAGYPLELVPPVPLPRTLSVDLARVPSRLWAAVRAAREVMARVQPDVLVGFGGYVCTPAYLAARKAKVPIVIHEGNALPGLANRVGAAFAEVVATSFPDTRLRHAEFVGLPIRRSISTLDRGELRELARAHFGLRPDLPVLLVTGGSQGARRINDSVSAAAADFAAAGVQVLHVKGPKGVVELPAGIGTAPTDGDASTGSPVSTASGVPYVVVDYVDRMELAYAAADAVVGRSGANSVTEAAAVGLPAVLVPLPIGNGEQALNARAVVEAGGAVLVADGELTPEWVRANLPGLLVDTQRLEAMSAAAAGLVRRDADEVLARLVLDLGGRA